MHEKRPKMDHHKVISEHESIKLTKSEALNDSKLVDRYSSWPVWTSCVGYLAAKYYSYPRSRSDYKKRTSSGIAPSRIFCTRKLWTRSICRNFFFPCLAFPCLFFEIMERIGCMMLETPPFIFKKAREVHWTFERSWVLNQTVWT